MIVEAASGAGLSLCYTQLIRDILPSLGQDCEVVVLVTGGSDISLAQLDEYRKKYYRPPVIVKSGGEVFLKMDDKLTHIQNIDISEPLGISSDNLTKINQGNKQKARELHKQQQQQLQQQRLQQQQQQLLEQQEQKQNLVIDTPMEELFLSTQEEEDGTSVKTPTPTNHNNNNNNNTNILINNTQ
jgi:DNA-binding transcriptional MerR regulator